MNEIVKKLSISLLRICAGGDAFYVIDRKYFAIKIDGLGYVRFEICEDIRREERKGAKILKMLKTTEARGFLPFALISLLFDQPLLCFL